MTATATRPRSEVLDEVADLPTEAQTRIRWRLARRPNQAPPDSTWNVWLILAGRGWGKTRTGAEWLADQAYLNPKTRWAIVAPTFADARDTCVEGESGLLAVLEHKVANWNRSLGELILRNGSKVKLFSADEPERLRGPQHHGAWCDELAAWRYPDAWDQLQFGLRLGDRPQSVVTTTPKPTKLVRKLADREGDGTVITRGHTRENRANLSESALAELEETYAGTRLGRQELAGELLTDTPGALWTLAQFDADGFRVDPADLDLERVVVAIDPAVTSGDESDETGIVVAGREHDGGFVVLADASGRYTPDGTGQRAVGLLDEWNADRIVAEANHGHDYIEAVVRHVDPNAPYRKVNASRGKRVRAEPVAALYEQGRVRHVAGLVELEEQMCSWTPDSGSSPDRMDALVWALSDLSGGRRRARVVVREAA